jgi:hypothetical protein
VSHVYHFTSSMHLPRILRDGELRPLTITEARIKYERSLASFGAPAMPSTDFLHATSDCRYEPTATPEYWTDGYEDGQWARVRFTLEADDFEPWLEVAQRNGFTEHQIKKLKDLGRKRGSDTRQWVCREKSLSVSRVVAIHTQDRINGDEWRLLCEGGTEARTYSVTGTEIMGVDIGKVNFWSKRFDSDQGVDGYDPVKVTATRQFEQVQPGTVTAINPEGWARLMREPESGKAQPVAANFLANAADPLAANVSSLKPTLPASDRAEIVTTPVRYRLDSDLVRAFDLDQLHAYKAQLLVEGRWKLPNDGGRYTIRFNYWDIPEVFGFTDEARTYWNGTKDGTKASDVQWFIDFDMDGDKMTRATDVVRLHLSGRSFEQNG